MAVRRPRIFSDRNPKRGLKRSRLSVLAVISCWLVVLSTPALSISTLSTPISIQEISATPPPTVHNDLLIADQALIAQVNQDPIDQGLIKQDLIDHGSALFAAGNLADAAEVWQQAATQYSAQHSGLAKARALHYLAIAYFNMGQWQQAQQANTESQTVLKENPQTGAVLLGASLNLQGQLQLVLGQIEQSIDTWKQAAVAYEAAGDLTGKLGAQLNRAKALQTLGHHQQSQQLLERLQSSIETQSDLAVKVTGLRLLGTALQSMGDLEQSQTLLTNGLDIAQQLAATTPHFADQVGAMRISLGHTLAARQQTMAALDQFQAAAAIARQPQSRIEAQLNQLRLLIDTELKAEHSTEHRAKQGSQPIQQLLSTLPAQLPTLPPSRERVYATVNFAASWIQVYSAAPMVIPSTVQQGDIAQLLANAVQVARSLSDTRAEAYALGQLGHLYETVQQGAEAQQLTRQAIGLSEGIDAPDLQATWQWQLGRLLKQEGKRTEAIAAYSHAVDALKSLRQSLSSFNADRQFSYLEKVEPVYRELVALLLAGNADPTQQEQAQLQKARELIEALQLAELDNFFHQACLQATPQSIDTIDATAAVVYPIILPDRLAVIVARPGKPLAHYETLLPKAELEATLTQLRRYLNPHFFETDQRRLSKQVYDWLIRPGQALFAETQTLVFVLDGALRNLPMGALYDGRQYLIERYSIALSPGLQLLDPQPLNKGSLSALTGGLSEAQQGFSALPAVDAEINQIAATLPATTLLNRAFTTQRLEQTLQKTPFSVVHLATHGQFSSQAEETFLVTWDGRVNVQDLDAMLLHRRQAVKQPLALLVLSACQTATGDQRAALGLAGMAIRSGARSTLATLWQVNDDSTAILMKQFYQQLLETPSMTKAEALRAAQLSLLKQPQYQHPFYWSPFVLVGNWL
ncbi:MAG: CHAT domain-containing protein [Cyanobacteria bacterium J06634_5]